MKSITLAQKLQKKVLENMVRRVELCPDMNGGHLQHFL